jgi:hypothetical protein
MHAIYHYFKTKVLMNLDVICLLFYCNLFKNSCVSKIIKKKKKTLITKDSRLNSTYRAWISSD